MSRPTRSRMASSSSTLARCGAPTPRARPTDGDYRGSQFPADFEVGLDNHRLRRRLGPPRSRYIEGAVRARGPDCLVEEPDVLYALLSAFFTVAGDVASDLEERATQGQLDAARPLVQRLEAIVSEFIPQVNDLSLETLRRQAGAAGGTSASPSSPTLSPSAATRQGWASACRSSVCSRAARTRGS
jgi:hypothetical protein